MARISYERPSQDVISPAGLVFIFHVTRLDWTPNRSDHDQIITAAITMAAVMILFMSW